MMTFVLIGVVMVFGVLFAAMALAPLAIEEVDEHEARATGPVSYERRLPQAA